ncbi:MAG TPA: DUF4342 domain-containing protein [Devosiaceae bacterium]
MSRQDSQQRWKSFTEEFEIAGNQLVDRITQLLRDGNVRRLRVRSESGEIYLDIPLTAGAIGGGVVALAAPWLALLGAVAGVLARVRIEVVRQEAEDEASEGKASKSDADIDI